jgi:hypothetical protein
LNRKVKRRIWKGWNKFRDKERIDNNRLTLLLVRLLDDILNQEWLVVKDSTHEWQSVDEAIEVTRLEWNDDLMIWMDAHQQEIEAGDVNTFLEYRRQHRLR